MSNLKWVGGSSDLFFDAGNWNPHIVPNSTFDVVIEPSFPTMIVVARSEINSLVTDANTTLAVGATGLLTILGAPDASNPTGASSNDGTFSVGQCAELFLDGRFTNAGLLGTGHDSEMFVNGTFTNTGTVNERGDVTLGDATHAGTLLNMHGATWTFNDAANLFAGAAAGSHLTNEGTLTRAGTGVTSIGVSTTNNGNVSVTSGELDFLSAVSNTGTMTATGATLSLDTAVSGVGTLNLGAGGTLNLVAGLDAGQTVDFLGDATLDLHAANAFAGHISGFRGNDVIDLVGTLADNKSFVGGVLTLSEGATPVAHLHFNGAYSTSNFSLSSDHAGGTLVHFVPLLVHVDSHPFNLV
jgi:hypothetical protein